MMLTQTLKTHQQRVVGIYLMNKTWFQVSSRYTFLQVVALTELGHLMVRLGSVVAASLLVPPSVPAANEEDSKPTTIGATKLLEVLVSVLPHSSAAPRAAAAWCLRCMAIACPTHLTPAIDVCLEGLENLRSSPEAVVGYSSALAAL